METQSQISVTDPIAPAWNHMVRILFKPFLFKKWIALGFCAFLSQCGEQGGNGSNAWNTPGKMNWNQTTDWIDANFAFFITMSSLAVLLIICLILFIAWISSRGKFMLLDGIVKNRGAVREPWKEFKSLANSLFFLSIGIQFLAILSIAIIGGLGVFIALPDINDNVFTIYGLIAIILTAILLLLFTVACIVVMFFMQIFLVPTMYLKRIRAIEAWKIAWAEFYVGHKWSSFLLLLTMLLFGIGAMVVSVFAMCATCCIAGLPYVSSVVLLPITVFFVCYALMYIQQFGEGWTFFKGLCPKCNYDRQGLENTINCPECGHSTES